jgi:hypothetical protein
MSKKLSQTKRAIALRRMRRNESPAQKRARLKKRYDGYARFEARMHRVPIEIIRNLTHKKWLKIKARRNARLRAFFEKRGA